MTLSSNIGFPRMGANRELKRLVENFWAGKVDEKSLYAGAKVRIIYQNFKSDD
jgi:5-methyltetrahydropteroyltriglutamate--homocysteine methyltransferase